MSLSLSAVKSYFYYYFSLGYYFSAGYFYCRKNSIVPMVS